MKFELVIANGLRFCRNPDCKWDSEYVTAKGKIRKGTSCTAVTLRSESGTNASYFCRACTELFYEESKKVMNTSLWVFL